MRNQFVNSRRLSAQGVRVAQNFCWLRIEPPISHPRDFTKQRLIRVGREEFAIAPGVGEGHTAIGQLARGELIIVMPSSGSGEVRAVAAGGVLDGGHVCV